MGRRKKEVIPPSLTPMQTRARFTLKLQQCLSSAILYPVSIGSLLIKHLDDAVYEELMLSYTSETIITMCEKSLLSIWDRLDTEERTVFALTETYNQLVPTWKLSDELVKEYFEKELKNLLDGGPYKDGRLLGRNILVTAINRFLYEGNAVIEIWDDQQALYEESVNAIFRNKVVSTQDVLRIPPLRVRQVLIVAFSQTAQGDVRGFENFLTTAQIEYRDTFEDLLTKALLYVAINRLFVDTDYLHTLVSFLKDHVDIQYEWDLEMIADQYSK